MKIVLDTNVLISGIFWTGAPEKILKAWEQQIISLAITPEILEEYSRVAHILAQRYPTIDIEPIMQLIMIHAELYQSVTLPEPVS